MKFVSKINKRLNTNLNLSDLFENPTLNALSRHLLLEQTDSSQTKESVLLTVEHAFKEVLGLNQLTRETDFFSMGGHSISAMKLLSKLNKEFNDILTLKDIFQHPSINLLSEYIVHHHLNIKEKLQEQHKDYVLSSNQEALWFDEKFNGNTTHYNIPQKYTVIGKVDIRSLETALNHVINRHEILRTIVREEGGRGYQEINEKINITIDHMDLSEVEREKQQSYIQKIEEEMQSTVFELEKGPLFSIQLITLSEREHILFANHHHFIFDGWSLSIFLDEWLSFYSSERSLEKPVLNHNFIQYKDFAMEQKNWLEHQFEEEILFWKNNLSGNLPKLQLPLDKERPKVSRNQGNSFIVELSDDDLKKLKRLSLESESTLFMTLLTLYQSFLASYTGQEEIIVGSPLANRMMPGTEGSIGYFVNTLPFRLHLESGEDFVKLIKRNTRHIIDVYEHQQMPLEKITEAINPERNLENSSLFQTVFILQNNEKAKLKTIDFELYPEIIKSNVAKFDLSLAAEEYQDKLLFAFEYNTEIFFENTIRSLSESFLRWIQSFINQPGYSIDSVPIINEKQEKTLMEEWQGKSILFDGINDSIPQAFYKIVNQYPDKIAVVGGTKKITYRELNIISNRLAHYLLGQGIASEEKIGIYMNRSIDMIVGILAVIKAGAAYIPLDPHYPINRLNYMIEDSSISYCLTHENLPKDGLRGISNMIYLEDVKHQFDVLRNSNLDMVNKNNLAYVIYTSGTTGRPKGVMIEHKGVINLIYNQKKMMQLDESAKMLQFATINFDSSVIEIFSSLLYGAELYISKDKENIFDINQLVSQIKADEISHIILPPAVLRELPIDELTSLKAVGSAGSECPVELVSKFKHISFFNGYGPTESTVGICFKLYPPNDDVLNNTIVPIGKPLSNSRVFVLDQHKRLVPIGIVGELYIGGPGLARGYLNNEGLTKEKFVPSPFHPFENLYGTGDLVKFNSNGELIYIGRADNQVKIRGYRVELAEINYALSKLSGVKDSFTVVNEDSFQNKKITTFYIADHELTDKMIREQLKGLLPDFMIPSQIIKLDKFPLTSNGKVDQEALINGAVPTHQPEHDVLKTDELTETELTLLEIWRKILDNPSIGPDDNFFESGGDSIISIQICSAAKEKQLSITPKKLFEHQTVRELARIVTEKEPKQVVQEKISGHIPLTPIQSWFFNEEHDNIHHWNQSIVLVKDNNLSKKQYEKILNKLIDHHDTLKTLFKKQNGAYIGEIHNDNNPFKISEYHVKNIDDEQVLLKIEELENEAQRSLNIQDGPIMNFTLFRGDHKVRILWVIHHLVVDGVSWRILLEDFERCYQQIIHNEEDLVLPAKTTSYKEWSEQLREYKRSKLSDDVIKYWEQELNQPISPMPENLGNQADMENTFKLEVNKTKTQKFLKNTLRKYKTTIDELLLSIIAHIFSKQIGLDKFWVDLEGHGRESIGEIDLTRTVGWFTSMYPVRLVGASTIGLSLKNTKNIVRSIPNKGFDYGILKYIFDHQYNYPKSIII